MPFTHKRPKHIEGCTQTPEPRTCYICPRLECPVFFGEFERISPEALAKLISIRTNQPQLGHGGSNSNHRRQRFDIKYKGGPYTPDQLRKATPPPVQTPPPEEEIIFTQAMLAEILRIRREKQS